MTIEDSLAYANGTLGDGTVNKNGDRNGHHGFTHNSNPGSMSVSDNVGIDNAERNFSFDTGTSVFRNDTSCRLAGGGSNDKTVDSSDQFWTGENGSRCASYTGTVKWSFASGGRLVVTFG
ncbi:hypothetical protein [Amycolatopsis sp. Hca4]|uniref:hypothetical protein n=1 Tax=Amycolatopsis sp. Hca4 TaxID=2742131 RepID=UPI0020CB0A12|nr:hypothetical protein [Amycolatopsis sp. Hca4]